MRPQIEDAQDADGGPGSPPGIGRGVMNSTERDGGSGPRLRHLASHNLPIREAVERRGDMTFRRGFMRLGLGLGVLWLVFWTCAYVISPPSSENAQKLPPPLSRTTDIVLLAVAILGMPWVVSGFRPNS